jgi:hypothetical protein
MMMTMMRWSPGHAASAVLAAGALALMPPAPASGQVRPDRSERQECRCVDRDGKEIENCTCFRMPDVEGIVARIMPFMGRARLGVTLTEGEYEGARVESVLEGGPAEEAGIREGDVITGIDGQSLLEPLDAADEDHFDLDRTLPVQRLVALARRLEPGDEVEVEYLRDGQTHTTALTARDLSRVGIVAPRVDMGGMAIRMRDLGDQVRELRVRRPEDFGVTVWSQEDEQPEWAVLPREGGFVSAFGRRGSWECPGDPGEQAFLTFSNRCVGGLELLDLKPGLADYFGTSRGVLVSDVDESSTLGLEPGDVILDIDGREATDPAQVRRVLLSYEDHEEITLRIMRRQSEMSVQGTLRG